MPNMPRCYRCDAILDRDPSSASSLSFYECSKCHSRYAKSNNTDLHDRWGMPLTIPLYSVIFDSDPSIRVDEVLDSLRRDHRDLLPILVEEIREELANPRQEVSQIYDFAHATEVQLRDFLAKIAEKIS